jgi:hypothetical protein
MLHLVDYITRGEIITRELGGIPDAFHAKHLEDSLEL